MIWFAKSYKGYGPGDEEEMTEKDWLLRGHQQAIAMMNGNNAFDSSPDEDGVPTGGVYNGDYPDAYHDELNRRLEEDEYYEAEVDGDLTSLRQATS